MDGELSLLGILEDAVARGTPEARRKALGFATDSFITGSYCDEDTWVFGEIIERLAADLEVAARARLGDRLATFSRAPANLMASLANDDSIEVAGRVLTHSEKLDNRTLVSIAQSKGQSHLLAMSRRRVLDEEVTDVLVARGNREVVNSVVSNPGARFSGGSFLDLVKRSENDSILAEHLSVRRDIPRHLFQQLIAKASDQVRRKLQHEIPQLAAEVDASVVAETGTMHSKFGPGSREYFAAKRAVTEQHRHGSLREKEIQRYAISHKFEETVISLSLLTGLTAEIVERAIMERSGETVLILCKALNFDWETAMAILFFGAQNNKLSRQQLDELQARFASLSIRAAKDVIHSLLDHKSLAAKPARLLAQKHAV